MKKTSNKIVLVGSGAVGTSFLYSAINQGIAEEYGIIDINDEVSYGNKLDLEDAVGSLDKNAKVKSGGYEQVENADIVVITAGRAQREGETRLDMISDNAKIIKGIAKSIKDNGFNGITVIASNPVDVMAATYQNVTGFDPKKVISSGCTLDTARLRLELSKIFKISPSEFSAFVLGEHGDSSVSTLEHASISGIPLNKIYLEYGIDQNKKDEIHEKVWKKAYEIINRKRATFYGIGAALTEITKAILRNEKKVFSTGVKLTGEYGHENVYASVPTLIGENGVIRTFEFPLADFEKVKFDKSIKTLKEATKIAFEAIK